MPATRPPKERAPRSRWLPAEKRRIVELTMCAGASLGAVAREHNVNPNSLYRWKRLYGAGKLDAQVKSTPRVTSPGASATFVPVNVVRAVRSPQPATRHDGAVYISGIMQLVLASGATLRIETGALDAALVCALVAELRR